MKITLVRLVLKETYDILQYNIFFYSIVRADTKLSCVYVQNIFQM